MNPFAYIEKFATLGSVSVEKTKVTFTASEGEGDDKFVFTLVGNKATLAESVGEIVRYLIKASNLVDSVLGELPMQAGVLPPDGKILKMPTPVSLTPDMSAQEVLTGQNPVFNREDFANDPEFKSIHDGGINFKPIAILPFKAQDQTFSFESNDQSGSQPENLGQAFVVKSPKASQ